MTKGRSISTNQSLSRSESKEMLNNLQIRWVLRSDLPSILAMEAKSTKYPFEEDDIAALLSQETCGNFLIEDTSTEERKVLGAIAYLLEGTSVEIIRLWVDIEGAEGRAVGKALLDKLVAKVHNTRFEVIFTTLRETEVHTQKLFQSLGFSATHVDKAVYLDSGEDGYVFEFFLV